MPVVVNMNLRLEARHQGGSSAVSVSELERLDVSAASARRWLHDAAQREFAIHAWQFCRRAYCCAIFQPQQPPLLRLAFFFIVEVEALRRAEVQPLSLFLVAASAAQPQRGK